MDPLTTIALAVPLSVVILLTAALGLVPVGVTAIAVLAFGTRDDATTSWARHGLRPTLDGGWVGQVHDRAVRVRRLCGATENDETRWSLELDLDDAELEVFNAHSTATWRTGDSAFDQIFRAMSAPRTIGILTASVRQKLLELTPDVRVHVIAGQLELVSASPHRLESRLGLAVEAARLLDASSASSVADRLALLVHGDPVDDVRAQALAVLRHIDAARAARVAHEVGAGGPPLLEIERALLLSDGSLVAAIVRDPALPATTRARAGRAAVRLLAPPACTPLADDLAEASDAVLDPAALELAVRAGRDGVPALLNLVRSFDDDTARGAAEQLGHIAGVGVVPELQQLAGRTSTRHAQRVRDAVRSIQARATAGRGELSVASSPAAHGALSVPAARGSLSESR